MVARLAVNGVIEEEDAEIYVFGLEQLITDVLEISSLLVLGLLLGELAGCLVFLASFMAIRVNAGGYHASTPLRCYGLTVLVTTAAILLLKENVPGAVYAVMAAASSIIVLITSPVGTKNRRTEGSERLTYRRRAIVTWALEMGIMAGCMALGAWNVAGGVALGVTVLGVSQAAELLIHGNGE